MPDQQRPGAPVRRISDVELGVARLDAFEVGQRRAPGRTLRFLDQHVRYVVANGEPRPATRADQGLSLSPQGGFAKGTDQERQQLVAHHWRCLSLSLRVGESGTRAAAEAPTHRWQSLWKTSSRRGRRN